MIRYLDMSKNEIYLTHILKLIQSESTTSPKYMSQNIRLLEGSIGINPHDFGQIQNVIYCMWNSQTGKSKDRKQILVYKGWGGERNGAWLFCKYRPFFWSSKNDLALTSDGCIVNVLSVTESYTLKWFILCLFCGLFYVLILPQ